MIAVVRRCGLALALAIGLVTGGSIVSQGPRTAAHSQLVTSVPGAGVVVEDPPTELRLVFSEPLEDDFTGLELVDAEGMTVSTQPRVDQADRRVLLASLPDLPDGVYTVNWTALSAADGHVTAGFISFVVGDAMVALPGGSGMGGMPGMTESGSVHAGHSGVEAAIENLSRSVADAGFMLTFGLFVIGAFVVRPAIPNSRGLLPAQIVSLGLAAAGTLVLLSFAGSAANLDPISYATGSRSGAFVGVRLVVGATLTVLAALAWFSGYRRFAALAAAVGGVVGILAIALGGHASGVPGLAAVIAMIVHIGAAAIWMAGVIAFVLLGVSGQLSSHAMRDAVPRFSALAVVAFGLIGATGAYSAWTQTRDLTPILTPYAAVLDAKVVVVGLALILGYLNLLDGGRDRGPLIRFAGRVRLEAFLALIVVGLSSTLASGSPPGNIAPIQIGEAASTAQTIVGSLALQPGRPGPNRLLVELEAEMPEGGAAEVQLRRLDASDGASTIDLRPSGEETGFVADGVVLAPDSRWDAAVVVRDAKATEIGRARFSWGLGADGISEGRSAPIVDPALVVGALLLAAGVMVLAFGIAGGRLPVVHPSVARLSLLSGGTLATALGLVIVIGGA